MNYDNWKSTDPRDAELEPKEEADRITEDDNEIHALAEYIAKLSTEERLRLTLLIKRPQHGVMTYSQLFDRLNRELGSNSFCLRVQTWVHQGEKHPVEWSLSLFLGDETSCQTLDAPSASELYAKYVDVAQNTVEPSDTDAVDVGF